MSYMEKEQADNMTEIRFAEFLYGTFATVQRKTKEMALKLATQYRKDGTFLRPSEISVTSGSIILTSDLSDFVRTSAQWRVYFVRALGSSILQALQWQDHERVASTFDAWTRQFSWGALDTALGHVAPNSLLVVARRLKSLIEFWPQLEKLRFIDADARIQLTLAEIVQSHYNLLIGQWVPTPSTDTRANIMYAVAAMCKASPSEVENHIVEALVNLAKKDSRIKHRNVIEDPSQLRELLSSALDQKEYEDLTGLHISTLRRALYILDETVESP
jgi:hypothetical protein